MSSGRVTVEPSSAFSSSCGNWSPASSFRPMVASSIQSGMRILTCTRSVGAGTTWRFGHLKADRDSWPQAENLGVAAFGRDIFAQRSLGGEPQQIVRSAGLGPGTGQAPPAERMHAHHRDDHIAVDVDVAGTGFSLTLRGRSRLCGYGYPCRYSPNPSHPPCSPGYRAFRSTPPPSVQPPNATSSKSSAATSHGPPSPTSGSRPTIGDKSSIGSSSRFRDGSTHVVLEPLELMAHIHVRHPSGDLRSSKSAVLPICHRPPDAMLRPLHK